MQLMQGIRIFLHERLLNMIIALWQVLADAADALKRTPDFVACACLAFVCHQLFVLRPIIVLR